MSDEQRQPDAWVGERWVIEELEDDFIDVAVAGVQSPFLFTTLVDRERRMNDAARADVIGILSRLERGDLDEGWTEEQGERLPTALVAPWLGRAVVVDGLFTATGQVEAGMVFIVTVLESATEGPNMAFPRLSEAGAVDRYRATSAAFRAMGGTDDALWDLTIGGYSQNSVVFDITEFAHAAVADLYEEALRTANGRPSRG